MTDTQGKQPIRIDVRGVLNERLGKRARLIPGFVKSWLERLIHQDDMNALLAENFPKRGADFCEGVLRSLDVTLDVTHADRLPADPRCIIISNHPLGGLDGISMIAWLARHYARPVHFVVNDLLMAVEPLRECFVPINKHGSQSRLAASLLDEVLAGDDPVVFYPAGMVSRLQPDGSIADLKWRKTFVNKAIASRRPVVPVHFDGQNSPRFYRMARLRERLGMKFNLEMILLPAEIFRSKGKTFRLSCGNPVPADQLAGADHADDQALTLRNAVYSLAPLNHQL